MNEQEAREEAARKSGIEPDQVTQDQVNLVRTADDIRGRLAAEKLIVEERNTGSWEDDLRHFVAAGRAALPASDKHVGPVEDA